MMKKAVVKRAGSNTVDLQLVGSTGVLFNIPVSAQVSWDMITPGQQVLVDSVEEQPVVLHTLSSSPNYYTPQPQSYTTVIENALLSDGSVPLQGNLDVFPGITIDGYDVSVLGQAISNLQAADTIARTGWTAFTHSTHLVSTISADATEILVRDAIFDLYEQITLSNTSGEIEFMRIDSAATQTLDDNGGVCYQYTVTRRINVSPSGLFTGWAAATLVNGLTKRGFITIDNRHRNSSNAPNISGSIWTDDPPVTNERIFRFGGLYGVLGIETSDFGVAIGNLDTQDTYLLFNASREQLELKNVDYKVIDIGDNQVIRMYGKNEDDRLAGDYDFGKIDQVHNSFYGESATWGIYRGTQPIIEVGDEHSYLRDLFTIGNPVGARIDLGDLDNNAIFALRDKHGIAKMVARTDDDSDVYVHIGNPPPEDNSMWFDSATGRLNVNGHVTMQSMDVRGRATFSSTGSFVITDPDNPQRYGVITPRGIYAYSVDALGQQYLSSVDAWAPLTLETRIGSGVWKTWLAGEMMKGDADYRRFCAERGPTGRVGLFNGDTPIAYIASNGVGYFSGIIEAAGGLFTGDIEVTTGSIVFPGGSLGASGLVLDADGFDLTNPNASVIQWVNNSNQVVSGVGAASNTAAAAYLAAYGDTATLPAIVNISAISGLDEGLLLNSDVVIGAYGALGSYEAELQLATRGVNTYAHLYSNYFNWKPQVDSTAAFVLRNASDASVVELDTSYSILKVTGGVTATGIVSPTWRPSADSTTALQLQSAAGTAVVTVDTSNSRLVLANGVPVMAGTDRLLHRYGTNNLFAGINAGNFTTTGTGGNVGLGAGALLALTDGYYNVGVGQNALEDLTSGNGNIALGAFAGRNLTTGYGNFALGYFSLQAGTQTIYNIAIGAEAMSAYNPGSVSGRNIAIGTSALGSLTSGVNNVGIGTTAGYSGNMSGAIYVGHGAGQYETADNRLILDSQWRTNEAGQRIGAPIYAEMSTTLTSQLVRVNGVLQSLMTDSATGTVTTQVKITHNTSSTVDNGFGGRVLWELESSTATDQAAAAIDGWWVDKTHSQRNGAISIYGSYAGTLYEGIRASAVSGAAALGFYGVDAIARPTTGSAAATFTANSGTAVNDASTFDGYTIKQVIKALRDIGILT